MEQKNQLPKLKFNKKLQLNKEDLVRLDEEQMRKISGGGDSLLDEPSDDDSEAGTKCTTNGAACSCTKKSCTA